MPKAASVRGVGELGFEWVAEGLGGLVGGVGLLVFLHVLGGVTEGLDVVDDCLVFLEPVAPICAVGAAVMVEGGQVFQDLWVGFCELVCVAGQDFHLGVVVEVGFFVMFGLVACPVFRGVARHVGHLLDWTFVCIVSCAGQAVWLLRCGRRAYGQEL